MGSGKVDPRWLSPVGFGALVILATSVKPPNQMLVGFQASSRPIFGYVARIIVHFANSEL